MHTGPEIKAARFEQDDTSATLLEQFDSVESLGLDWSVYDFGVTRIEATVKTSGPYGAYDRYNDHYGQRLAFYGDGGHQPISGWIYETEWLPGDRIRYVAYGPNFRMEDAYIVRKFDATDTVTNAIQYITSRIKPAADSTDNIVNNTTPLDGWQTAYPQGDFPTDAIRQLINFSDSSSRIYDYRLIDQPLSNTNLRQFDAYFTYRDSTSDPNWIVKRKDLSRLNLSRNISDFANIVRVWYGLIEGTSTGSTSTTITDASASFITDGVSPGDQVVNKTRGDKTRVVSVNSQTNLTHEGWNSKYRGVATGGTLTTLVDGEADFINDGVQNGDILKNIPASTAAGSDVVGTVTGVTATVITMAGGMTGGIQNNAEERYEIRGSMTVGDDYVITTQAQTKYAEFQIDKGLLWDKEIAEFERSMNSTQAAQYAEALATVTPQQVQSFVISSPFIEDGAGAMRPLYDMLLYGGGYIRVPDLYPAASVFGDALNALTTFWITGMSYDYKSNSLTVDVDNLSRRLDARLRRAQILRVPQVRRYLPNGN
jgi:hypothetical protein